MAEEKRNAEQQGGEYMIQDRDHLSGIGQVGGESNRGRGRQSEQSMGDSRHEGTGQQGGERSRRRSKLL